MNWIKDKKNAPIVIGLLVAVAIAAIFFSLYQLGVIGGSNAAQETASSPAPVPASTSETNAAAPPAVPGTPSASALPASALPPTSTILGSSGLQKSASVGSKVLTTKDPFRLPVTPQQDSEKKKASAELTRSLVAPLSIASYKSTDRLPDSKGRPGNAPITNPNQRVSGILYNNGVYAILETNGVSEAVRPGQSVDGGRVVSIQSDGLTLSTENNQTIKVPLQPTANGGVAGGSFPGNGFPGAGGFPGPSGSGPGKGFGSAGGGVTGGND